MIKNIKKLSTSKRRKHALDIIEEGLKACDPQKIIKENISLKGKKLTIQGKNYDLKDYKDIYLIGFGKMAISVATELKKIISFKKGIIIDTEYKNLGKKIEVYQGTHPLPSKKNIIATKKIVDLVGNLSEKDLVICIISGGGSSLLCLPTLDFDEYMKKLKKVIFSGVNIVRLNKFRKRYSQVKGGRLGHIISPTKYINLYFSDVMGDKLDVIASGPTYSKKTDNFLLLNHDIGLDVMKKKAKSLGYHVKITSDKFKGYSRNFGKVLIEKFGSKRNVCLIAGCETTVKMKEDHFESGKGGRNQEVCLGALDHIGDFTLASIDSDGIDGITEAAGAIIDKETFYISSSHKLYPEKYLAKNNSFNFLKKTNSLIYTGKTGINVMDFVILLRG
jgi:glycerate-2-kinase